MLTLESIAIAVDQWFGSAADPASSVASTAITPVFLVVAAISAAAFGLWYRGNDPDVQLAGDDTRLTSSWRPEQARRYPRACTFAQVSFSVSVRLNTSASGRESASGVK